VSAEGNVNVGVDAVPETEPPGHDNVGGNEVPETEPPGHDNVGGNVVPETGRGHKRRGRPRKNKDVIGIDEVVKQVLSDFEFTDGEDEDLYYDSDEVRKERDGTSHWWDSVEFNVNEGVGVGECQPNEVEESDGLSSLGDSDSDGVKPKKYRQFNEKHDLTRPIKLALGDQFRDAYEFKRALKTFAVQNGFDYYYRHNDLGRVSAICRGHEQNDCKWRIHASIDATRACFQIKTLYPTHTCGIQYENTRCDVEYLVRVYKKDFKDDPTWTPYALQQRVKRDLNIDVPVDRCYRAKKEALRLIFGSHSSQYRLTRRYALAILSTNPGSSAYVCRDGAFFQRMYICLEACKKGFKSGCRPMLCLDVCHLKGEYGGQLLCAIGIDGNDDMFPIAYAVAEAECRESWQWFIQLLFTDLCGAEGGLGWTIMTDRQKVMVY
jgi:hypothetical protein